MKPFKFIMLMFFTILITAGLTIFALTFGDKKAVEVKVPTVRKEFSKLYEAYDLLKTTITKISTMRKWSMAQLMACLTL